MWQEVKNWAMPFSERAFAPRPSSTWNGELRFLESLGISTFNPRTQAFSNMSEFHTVAKVGQIPEGEGRAFQVGGRLIAVFRRQGEYFAMNDACPHMGASLAEGYLDGDIVHCPWHAWRFCIKDGVWVDNPKSKTCNPTYETRVIGEEIQVSLPAT